MYQDHLYIKFSCTCTPGRLEMVVVVMVKEERCLSLGPVCPSLGNWAWRKAEHVAEECDGRTKRKKKCTQNKKLRPCRDFRSDRSVIHRRLFSSHQTSDSCDTRPANHEVFRIRMLSCEKTGNFAPEDHQTKAEVKTCRPFEFLAQKLPPTLFLPHLSFTEQTKRCPQFPPTELLPLTANKGRGRLRFDGLFACTMETRTFLVSFSTTTTWLCLTCDDVGWLLIVLNSVFLIGGGANVSWFFFLQIF